MYKNGTPIRLVGVRVDNLVEKDEVQISLFGNTENEKKQEKLDSVVDQLKQNMDIIVLQEQENFIQKM